MGTIPLILIVEILIYVPSIANFRVNRLNDRLAAACGRACLVALEGRIGNRFDAPFRKRSTWSRDIEGRVSVTPLERKGS